MDEPSSDVPKRELPLVLRKAPPQREHIARSMIAHETDAVSGIWWELVDAAAAPEQPAMGVALTHNGAEGRVTVSALGARHANAEHVYAELLRGLLAALRRHDADTVIVHAADQAVVGALLAVGFLPAPDDGDRYLIVL